MYVLQSVQKSMGTHASNSVLQTFMKCCRMEMAKDSRLISRIVSIVKLVISWIPTRLSTGSRLKVVTVPFGLIYREVTKADSLAKNTGGFNQRIRARAKEPFKS